MKPINNLPRKTFFKEQLGNLKNLTTDIKTDLVSAINWLHSFLLEKLGDADISTIGDGTVTGAIKQVNSDLTSLFKSQKNCKSDLNNLTQQGFYEYTTNEVVNLPTYDSDDAFHVIVFGNNETCVQIYIGYMAGHCIGVHMRSCWSIADNDWKSWVQLA